MQTTQSKIWFIASLTNQTVFSCANMTAQSFLTQRDNTLYYDITGVKVAGNGPQVLYVDNTQKNGHLQLE